MDDRFNTIAGWTLFAGIIALGASIASDVLSHWPWLPAPFASYQVVDAVLALVAPIGTPGARTTSEPDLGAA